MKELELLNLKLGLMELKEKLESFAKGNWGHGGRPGSVGGSSGGGSDGGGGGSGLSEQLPEIIKGVVGTISGKEVTERAVKSIVKDVYGERIQTEARKNLGLVVVKEAWQFAPPNVRKESEKILEELTKKITPLINDMLKTRGKVGAEPEGRKVTLG